ncbi:MAG TPA: hypothetical protein VJN18_17285 [Polyangiaceae bacterium]|nr:hypothetical protein [Polyangiaceae bacterium]
MRLPTLPFVLALGLLPITLAGSSRAQTDSAKADGYFYDFKDDYMVGDTISSNTAILKVRKPAARVTLIRPRTHFVAEMIKSVELM